MQSVAWWPTLLVLGVACFTDLRSRRIPNLLVGPFAVLGVAVNCLLRGASGLGGSLAGMCLAIGICGIFCFLRGMGMGDLKLCGSIGAWVGPQQMAFAMVVTFIAGAVIGLVWAASARRLTKSLSSTGDLLASFASRGIRPHETIVLDQPGGLKIPYAPAIAVGTWFSFFAF